MLNPIEFPDGAGMQAAMQDARVLERLLTSMEEHWALPDATTVSLVAMTHMRSRFPVCSAWLIHGPAKAPRTCPWQGRHTA
jgi:hypothetical protein